MRSHQERSVSLYSITASTSSFFASHRMKISLYDIKRFYSTNLKRKLQELVSNDTDACSTNYITDFPPVMLLSEFFLHFFLDCKWDNASDLLGCCADTITKLFWLTSLVNTEICEQGTLDITNEAQKLRSGLSQRYEVVRATQPCTTRAYNIH